jgi:hypothetical protein
MDDFDNEDKVGPVDDPMIVELLEKMKVAIPVSDEDQDQKSLVTIIQENRALLLKYAMGKYLENPKSASLLEGVTSLIAHMEKTVRDDRKERAKKADSQNNVLAFNQMLDAMAKINEGKVLMPHFDMSDFILDPGKTLLISADIAPIKPEELVMGNHVVDLDGNPV